MDHNFENHPHVRMQKNHIQYTWVVQVDGTLLVFTLSRSEQGIADPPATSCSIAGCVCVQLVRSWSTSVCLSVSVCLEDYIMIIVL